MALDGYFHAAVRYGHQVLFGRSRLPDSGGRRPIMKAPHNPTIDCINNVLHFVGLVLAGS